jgi:hypothetical protein
MDWSKPGVFTNNSKEPRISELVTNMIQLKDGELNDYRAIGPSYTMAMYWVEIRKKAGGTVRIPKFATNWNPLKGEFEGKCPYAEILGLRPTIVLLQNYIDRKAQRLAPKKQPEPLKSEKRRKVIITDDVESEETMWRTKAIRGRLL